MELLIKGARIVDASQDFPGDVYIKDGFIEEIGKNLNKDCKTLHARGLMLLPSFIDLHSHFRDPGLTHKEDLLTGSLAAIKGGYTAVNLMANTKPVCDNMDIVNYVLKKAGKVGIVDVHQTVSITRELGGKDTNHIDELEPSVKFISDDGKGVLNSKVMIEAMMKAKKKGIRIITHAENEELTEVDTRLAENTMTWRDISLAKFTGCPLHVAHVSTKEAMEYIVEAKKSGYDITCEVTPHHIALTEDVEYRVNPPLRKKEDIEFLIRCIQEGWVDAIGTDHAPHTLEDKQNGVPGISGIETAFSVCYSKLVKKGYITLNKLSEIMSKNPARIMGLNKGEIKIGYDGDLTLIDIQRKVNVSSEEFASKGKNTPFEGMKLYGVIVMTIKSGKVVYKNSSYVSQGLEG
ncbi:dihydroorotase [Fonticella tunisiensis]|nr:dihydroorotase [Fonticella tunisiensis]